MILVKGDFVSVLDEDFSGTVVSVDKNQVTIETVDGFMMNYDIKELLKMNQEEDILKVTNHSILTSIMDKKEPVKRSFVKEKKSKKEEFVLEVDLHIEKLVPNKRGMSNYDILTLQSETAKRQIEFAIKNRMPKIVFIHGVGEGILKAELDFLFGRYEDITFKDANYQKYGVGATEVYIKQNKSK